MEPPVGPQPHLAPCRPPGPRLREGGAQPSRGLLCSVLRLHQEKTDTVRCIKSCRPRDVRCMLDLVHTVSHTVVSLPTFREFAHPEGKRRPHGLELAWGSQGRPLSREAPCGFGV